MLSGDMYNDVWFMIMLEEEILLKNKKKSYSVIFFNIFFNELKKKQATDSDINCLFKYVVMLHYFYCYYPL